MTVDAEPFRRSRKGFNLERTESAKARHEKKHFMDQKELVRVEKKVVKKIWKPSENLLDYNRKKLLCYTGSRKQKRKVLGKNMNDSQIFNMPEVEKATAHKPRGMKPKNADFKNPTRNQALTSAYRAQTMQYQLNRINSKKSLVFS